MAKKSRTPKPPAVQAPKRRDASSGASRGSASSIPPWAWLVGVVILLAIAAGAFALTRGGSSEADTSNVKAAMLAAGCTYRDVKPFPPKDGGNYHNDAPTLASKVKWSTFPPSAGGHYAQWAVWGFYREPANPLQVVHNLEHGGIVMWWGPRVPASTVDQLEAFYNESPDAMFGTPIAGLGNKIALTAWTGDPAHYYEDGDYGMGHIAICPKFDQAAFKAFRDAYRHGGPEGFPLSSAKPGMGPG